MEGIVSWIFSEEFLSNPLKVRAAIDEALKDPYPQQPVGAMGQMPCAHLI